MWRSVHEASISPRGIWGLAKWACKKSFLPLDLPQTPDMKWQGVVYNTVEGKAEALAGWFYPVVEADTDNIMNQELETLGGELVIDQRVLAEDVRSILRSIKPDKCPGMDEIPNRFLKAMGEPLVKAVQSLITAVFKLSYFPLCFQSTRTIVLCKPQKPDYSNPGVWRPIALLSTIGKVIEMLAACRLSALAEHEKLLPDAQMGNRKNRSTDTALEMLTEQIHTVWQEGCQVASVLSLDISGAFDTVCHVRLLDNLRKKRVSLWFTKLVQSFLTDWNTTLIIDRVETAARQLRAGVPQGSLLSPILFLFYNGPLIEALSHMEAPFSPIGFADDINLLAYGPSTGQNCINLQHGHNICLEWVCTHGACFMPDKYKLTHFTRKRRVNLQMPVTLAGTTVQPEPSIKVLGVLLDTQLKWGAQEQAVWKKMGNQMLALQRTTTSTWGATMPKARQVYQAVVHPAIAHGALAWHRPTKLKDKKGA